MKKIITIMCSVIMAIALSGNYLIRDTEKNYNAQIYYVDHSMLRLIPVDYEIKSSTKQKACEQIINKITEGEDYNRKIMRVVPDIKNGMKINIADKTAYVDFSKEFTENIPENKIHEILMIYSIVNSLTSVEGVDMVKFRFQGEERKEYIGGMDMRESFIPDYNI